MTDDELEGRVGFGTDGETLRVRDALEGEELRLRLDREPETRPALPELFPVPVDRAVSFEAESISIADYSSVNVREAGGEFIAQLSEPMELPRGSYCFDVNSVTKALVRVVDVDVSTTGMAGSEPVRLEFDRPTTVTVGARSLHTRPEATITVPDDPTALAEAVSVLGSSIKEFSPERSWPTLRGYPPRIERGDELDVPSPLVHPDTGVEVVVRPTYADVYRLSTLTYYLGAEMVIGDEPAVRLDTGYVESLPTDCPALEKRVTELLRTWFFLDTLARTEGYVPSNRYEYDQIGPELPFYPPNLADLSMSERLMEYLEVDPGTVDPFAPAWPTEAVLRPGPGGAELLPHLAHVLAPVRVRGGAEPPRPDAPIALATSPWLAPEDGVPNPDADPVPASASVITPESYDNRFRRSLTPRGEVRVVAIVESAERAADLRRALSDPAVPEAVGSWEVFDRSDCETVESILSDPETDLAYCGLPTDGNRLMTGDGSIAIEDLDDAPSLTIFEGTNDVEAGVSVVQNGSVSAICAARPLGMRSLRTLIGTISRGVPVSMAVSVLTAERDNAIRVVGDPGTAITTVQGLPIQIFSVRSVDQNSHQATRSTALTMCHRIGGEQKISFDEYSDQVELAGVEERETVTVDAAELIEIFAEPDTVLHLNGEVVIPSDGITKEQIVESARRGLANDSVPDLTIRSASDRSSN
ncbi:hypothetical protein [Halorubrum trueperi]|uniref:Uncharacterized protein n=1 Tax=Halorubrum trueperi TaxID=2004704 RepID=A0ABD5USE3_9EURY